ncbi:glycosyltransferase family 1 protein [Deinococcus sp. 6YEL10]|uniref:glycosyltransferase n=1 Tax=Deinococcus sp. 6YEL10 TaxID=2745870 RepID=UPI001E5D0AF2|nr:glycosyltransferase [Deinococcus sp. 6YEL10]MCD0162395.1 glycosyltransferase family 1 protein [Deinococcus sp. 6YEL10]
MRVTLIALGSRGDVQPYVALGLGLRRAGHAVRLASHEAFRALVTGAGLEFAPMRGNVQEVVNSPEMRAALAGGNMLAINRVSARATQQGALLWAEDGLVAARDADLLVAGIGGMNVAQALSEKLRVPLVEAHVVPFHPTRAFPGAIFPPATARLGGWANRLSHVLTRQVMWQMFRSADTRARREVLGLSPAPWSGPRPLRPLPTLHGISPAVLPRPADWDASQHLTGYWFLPQEAWTPPPTLEAFLNAGPPPVSIGFGSMTTPDPQATTRAVVAALARSGQRAVLLSGWGGLSAADVPDTVFVTDSVPHDWLFPRVAAVVHHGGAGTTAAGLAAGVPNVIVPFFGDQPFWGDRVQRLGVGPAPVPRRALNEQTLAEALTRAVTDAGMHDRAAALGARIRAEDGVARAAEVISGLKL